MRKGKLMNILIAEDEMEMSNAIVAILEHSGFSVDAAYDGEEALKLAKDNSYDCMICDIMMPKKDGIEVVKYLRSVGENMPIIMLTAKSEIEDRITGLDAGADDYLSKPFAMGELLARIRSMTRRGKEYTPKKLNAGSVTLNVNEQELVSSNSIRLAGMEAKMMEYFMLNFNKEISTRALFDHVWGNEDEGNEELVFVYVSYLRQKLRAIDADIKIDGDENGYILCDI